MITTTRPSLGDRLKADCWDLHERAEHGVFARAMAGGELGREAYRRLLEQSVVMHRALDAALRSVKHPLIEACVGDEQMLGERTAADLSFFGGDAGAVEPLREASAFVDAVAAAIERGDGAFIFGLHYVREGANNGNRYVAAKLRQSFGIEGEEGTRSLDPYGSEQRRVWLGFKDTLNEVSAGLADSEHDAVVAGARAMFEHTIALHGALAV